MGSSTGAYLSICELARHSTTIYPWEFSGSLLFSTSLPNRCIPNQLQIPVHVSRILKFVWKVYGFKKKIESGRGSPLDFVCGISRPQKRDQTEKYNEDFGLFENF